MIAVADVRRRIPRMRRAARPQLPLTSLFAACFGYGSAVGMGTGAVMGCIVALPLGPFAVVGGAYGAVVGTTLGAALAIVIGAVVTVGAALRHKPLRDPRAFHREFWFVLTVSLLLLNCVPLSVMAVDAQPRTTALFAAFCAGTTLTLLLFLRPAARRIAVAYARASGWEFEQHEPFR